MEGGGWVGNTCAGSWSYSMPHCTTPTTVARPWCRGSCVSGVKLSSTTVDFHDCILRGFYEVVPPRLISIFDFQELELLCCGLGSIDTDDWERNTRYTGDYGTTHGAQVVKWFWNVVRGMSAEHRAKLLQFTTGTSGVPVQGFAALMSYDGKTAKFTIDVIKGVEPLPASSSLGSALVYYPKAHTCFNRITLPLYRNERQLEDYLTLAIDMEMRMDLQ